MLENELKIFKVVYEHKENGVIFNEGYVAKTPEEAMKKDFRHKFPNEYSLVEVVEISSSELIAISPRLNWGLNFHHKNGNVYKVKLPKKLHYGDEIVNNGITYKRIYGAEGISDCNGCIYCYYYSPSKEELQTFFIADYDDYINQVKRKIKD